MASFDIPPETRGKQHQASNPNQSVWVSANAGSGKTHVLASRVIRLLLQGVAPSKILCLTFTKAAAANMASRVFDKLATWTQLSDDDLGRQIVETGAPAPGNQQIDRGAKTFRADARDARRLKNPDDPRLLRTAAAFVSVRGQCPVALRGARTSCATRNCCSAPGARFSPRRIPDKGALGAAVQRVTDECGPEGFDDLIKEAMEHYATLRAPSPHEPMEILRRSLGLAEDRDIARIEREMVEDGIAPARWSDHCGGSRIRQAGRSR